MKRKLLLIIPIVIVPIIILPTTIACGGARHQYQREGYIADYLEDIRNLIKDYLEFLKEGKNEKRT